MGNFFKNLIGVGYVLGGIAVNGVKGVVKKVFGKKK